MYALMTSAEWADANGRSCDCSRAPVPCCDWLTLSDYWTILSSRMCMFNQLDHRPTVGRLSDDIHFEVLCVDAVTLVSMGDFMFR